LIQFEKEYCEEDGLLGDVNFYLKVMMIVTSKMTVRFNAI